MPVKTDLSAVKVGDMVAVIKSGDFGRINKWTGTLHEVTRVTEKSFMIHNRWIDKATGRERGGVGGHSYIPATPEMIAEVQKKETARKQEEALREQFNQRLDYYLASAIAYALENMTHDSHPLDRLTLAEWELFHSRIVGASIEDDYARKLVTKFPESDDKQARLFLRSHNTNIDKTPLQFMQDDPSAQERLESLFDRYLHPADVF